MVLSLFSVRLLLVFLISVILITHSGDWMLDESPFECGLNFNLSINSPFSFQFFVIAVLFLIFDVEISLVVPFSLEAKTLLNSNHIGLVLLVLLIGVFYEWKGGKISWSKWMRNSPLQGEVVFSMGEVNKGLLILINSGFTLLYSIFHFRWNFKRVVLLVFSTPSIWLNENIEAFA